MLGLRSIPWKWRYSREDGDLMDIVLRPALSCSISYDRTTGYFNALAFVIAADGIEALVGNDGSMRLITGCLTTPAEAAAIERGELDAVHVRTGRRKGLRIRIPAPISGLF